MSANPNSRDWRGEITGQIRSVEDAHAQMHQDLIQWGRWGREFLPNRPRISRSGVWTLPGESDPDRDTESAPEPLRAPLDERMILILDARINARTFPYTWVQVLKANYIRSLPEHQRPREAKCHSDKFVQWLDAALNFLEKS